MSMVSSTENYANYRTRFLLNVLVPSFLFPPLVSVLLGHLAVRNGCEIPGYILIVFYILSIPTAFFAKVFIHRWNMRREARNLGARMIPRVKGRWPGNIDLIFRMRTFAKEKYLTQGMIEIMKEYNCTTLNIGMFWGDQIFTIDEGVVKFVLATGFEHFSKGVDQKERMESFLGNGIFNRDGEIWKMHRAMTRPFFARERISDFEHFEKYTAKTLDKLEQTGLAIPIDVQDLFARFTLDTASAFLFNDKIDTLSLPLPRAYVAKMGPKGSTIEGSFGAFATAFEQGQQVISNRARRRVGWQLYEMLENKGLESAKVIEQWLDPIVKEVLQEKRGNDREGKTKGEETSFLEYLVASTDDVKLIREELLNILLASRDTTASLLTSVTYIFTQHPDVLHQLRSEIMAACPPGKIPSYDDLRDMKYLRAVLNETLRVFPPVPINGRASRESAVTIPTSPTSDWSQRTDSKPLYIPANTSIVYLTMAIHKRKDLWGEDANDFDPMRWLDGRLEKMVKNPLIFVPFNAGPRICVGQQFALNEASFFLVRLLQVYDGFELALGAQPKGSLPPASWKNAEEGRASREKVWFSSSLTLFVKGGLWVKFHKADATDQVA